MVEEPQPNLAPSPTPATADAHAPALITGVAGRGKRQPLWILTLLGGGVLVSAVVCIGLMCLMSGFAALFVAGEQDDVAVAIDAVIRAMSDRDADRAYDLFAASPQHTDLKSELESSLTGAEFALIDGYRRVEVSEITIGVQSGNDPAEARGIVAQVAGLVHYTGGFVGTFDAVLVKEQGVWKLWNMNINVSPEKIEDYLSRQP